MFKFCVLIWFILLISISNSKNFNGYQVLKITPTSNIQIPYLIMLASDSNINFWDQILFEPNYSIRAMIPPERVENIRKYFARLNVPNEILIEDVQK